ncbi:MAG: DNA-directed RNA polymerase subunit omega [Mariprofundaceae bacterium]|nr:DNA-directed RNA polymerase subunit omega [Mariprofundaceae bacterium]
MARVTIEDGICYYPNRFELVLLAAKRARQIQSGMPSLVEDEDAKHVVKALREVGDGLMTWDVLAEIEQHEADRLEDLETEA